MGASAKQLPIHFLLYKNNCEALQYKNNGKKKVRGEHDWYSKTQSNFEKFDACSTQEGALFVSAQQSTRPL
jgi:hypothetical protein